MAMININIERKVWGAPRNSRGDSVIEFTSGVSREADNFGVPLSGKLPSDHAAIFAFTKPSGRVTMAIAQGEYTRFEGMGRSYNMRGIAELSPTDAERLQRPLATLLDHLDLIHDYDAENRQVSAAVTVSDGSATVAPLAGDNLIIARAIALALQQGRKVLVRLPASEALFGDKMRQSRCLRALVNTIDALPAAERTRMGLAFGVEADVEAYSRFVGDATIIAHFGEVKAGNAIVLDWSTGRLFQDKEIATSNALTLLLKKYRQLRVTTGDGTNGIDPSGTGTTATDGASGGDQSGTGATGGGDGANGTDPIGTEATTTDGSSWARWWRALLKAGPLPLLLALVCFALGTALGTWFAAPETPHPVTPVNHGPNGVDPSTPCLVQTLHYAVTDSTRRTQEFNDTLVGDIAFDHPMTHVAKWNLDALFKTNNVFVTFNMKSRDNHEYADTAMSRPIDKERLMDLDKAYFAALDSTAMASDFATDCTLELSNGTTITITPSNSLLSQSLAFDQMVQVKSLNVAGRQFVIDNEAFQQLNGGMKRGLNMPVYYLWVVTELERYRNEAGINKLFAY